jgi:hypothetical protein
MRRVGWIVVGRGNSGEAGHHFLDTAAPTRGAAIQKWCPPEMLPRDRRRHWKHLRKVGRAKLVRVYIKEVG